MLEDLSPLWSESSFVAGHYAISLYQVLSILILVCAHHSLSGLDLPVTMAVAIANLAAIRPLLILNS